MAVYEDVHFLQGDEHGPGNELGSHVPGLDMALPGLEGVGVDMGALSAEVPPQQDAMAGLTGDGSAQFIDPKTPDTAGFDAMRGLADGQQQEVVLTNENMYLQPHLPVGYSGGDGHSEIEGE